MSNEIVKFSVICPYCASNPESQDENNCNVCGGIHELEFTGKKLRSFTDRMQLDAALNNVFQPEDDDSITAGEDRRFEMVAIRDSLQQELFGEMEKENKQDYRKQIEQQITSAFDNDPKRYSKWLKFMHLNEMLKDAQQVVELNYLIKQKPDFVNFNDESQISLTRRVYEEYNKAISPFRRADSNDRT